MMTKRNQHIGAALLAGLFLIFSVGLPVVVASCPMLSGSSLPCCPQQGGEAGSSIHAPRHYDCCKTVIAAERNLTEFLAAAQAAPAPALLPSLLEAPAVAVTPLPPSTPAASASPPDIPIRCSSLLI